MSVDKGKLRLGAHPRPSSCRAGPPLGLPAQAAEPQLLLTLCPRHREDQETRLVPPLWTVAASGRPSPAPLPSGAGIARKMQGVLWKTGSLARHQGDPLTSGHLAMQQQTEDAP